MTAGHQKTHAHQPAPPSVPPGYHPNLPTSGPWQHNPTVGSGKDLIVHSSTLRKAGRSLDTMATELRTALARWHDQVDPASQAGAAGTWPEAKQLATAITRTHGSVGSFATTLADVHEQVSAGLAKSADLYADGETSAATATTAAIRKDDHSKSAWRIQYGGADSRAGHRQSDRVDWTRVRDVTAGATFRRHAVTNYSADHIKAMVAATDPDAITEASDGYRKLHHVLSDIAAALDHSTRSLADDWAGQAAVKALNHFQMLYQTAAELSQNAHQTAQALTAYGPALASTKAKLARMPAPPAPAHHTAAPSGGVSLAGLSPAAASPQAQARTQAIQDELDSLNTKIESAYTVMPSSVRMNLPPVASPSPAPGPTPPRSTPAPPGGSPEPPPGSSPGPPGPSQPPGTDPQPPGSPPQPPGTSPEPAGGPSDPAGPWSGGGSLPAGGTIGSGRYAAGGSSGDGGYGGYGPGGGAEGPEVPGAVGGTGTDATFGSDGMITSGAGTAEAAASGRVGFPVGLGGGFAQGQNGQARIRDTFGETEDEQTWRAGAGDYPPDDLSGADASGAIGGAAAPDFDDFDYTYDYS